MTPQNWMTTMIAEYNQLSSHFSTENIQDIIKLIQSDIPQLEKWMHLCNHYLSPSLAFQCHQMLYRQVFPPNTLHTSIIPSFEMIKSSNIWKWMKENKIHSFLAFDQTSQKKPSQYWHYLFPNQTEKFDLMKALLNHEADKNAILCQKSSGRVNSITYQELFEKTTLIATHLHNNKVKKGDHIILATVMNIHTICCYLAIIRLGAICIPIDPTFETLSNPNLKNFDPKFIFTENLIYHEMKAFSPYEILHQNMYLKDIPIIINDLEGVPQQTNTLSYILKHTIPEISEPYLHDCSDDIQILHHTPLTLKQILHHYAQNFIFLDAKCKDIWCWTSHLASISGVNTLFTTLFSGGTLALFEGSPHGRSFLHFVAKYKINKLAVTPEMLQRWKTQKYFETYHIDWPEIDMIVYQVSTQAYIVNQDENIFYLMGKVYYGAWIWCHHSDKKMYFTNTILENTAPSDFMLQEKTHTPPPVTFDFEKILHES